MKIMILLACLSTIVPAICTEVQFGGGTDSMVSSQNGIVSGGDFITTDVDTPNELGFTAGVRAHAELPEGAVGYAYSRWTKTNTTSLTLSTSGNNMTASDGNGYLLTVGYGGTVSADVIKSSPMGVAVSDAEISARAHANTETNQMDGMANILASTSNTGIGQTRSLASGNSSYSVMKINTTDQTSNMTDSRDAVFGSVSGMIELHSVNLDNQFILDENGMSTGTPQGTVSGSAYIRSISESNNQTSTSNTTIAVDHLTAMRLGMDGVSHIGGTINGAALAGTSKGGVTTTTNNTGGNDTNGNDTGGNDTNGNDTGDSQLSLSELITGNESTLSMVKGMLGGMSNAYAPDDFADASSILRADAVVMGGSASTNMTNTTGGISSLNATGVANTSVSVVRTNASIPSTAASAESMIVNGSIRSMAKNATSITVNGNNTGNGNGNDTGNNGGGLSPLAGGGIPGLGGISGTDDAAGGGIGLAQIGNDTGNATTMVVEANASRIDMRSAISAVNAWSGDNSITKTLIASNNRGTGNNNSTTNEPVINARITNVIVNNGPAMNGSVLDYSLATENATGLNVNATTGNRSASITIANISMQSFINGNSSMPGGLAVLGPISPPIFDNSTGSQSNVTGPVSMPTSGQDNNSNVITYTVTTGQMVGNSTAEESM